MPDDASTAMPARGATWLPVWTERDADRADWNGFEACFESLDAYERWTARVAALLVRELQLGPDDVVADLGCGTGRVASLIAPHVAQVVALDYSETVLGVARERRGLANIEYRHADLNVLDTATLPVTKAYAVGALFYLDSHDVVRRVVRGLVGRGAWVAALDLPDAREEDQHARDYDRSTFTHLRFDPAEVVTWFPGAEVQPWPDDIGYVHQAWRVNLFVRP